MGLNSPIHQFANSPNKKGGDLSTAALPPSLFELRRDKNLPIYSLTN
jgi:hypothetical protein